MVLTPTTPGRYETRALGTRAEILTVDPWAIDAAAALLEAGLSWVDRLASRFRADSELSALNAARGTTFAASRDLMEAIEVALRAARLTDGLVTPTVGKALADVGYDRDFAAMDSDQAGPLGPAEPAPSWTAVGLDPGARTIRVPPGVLIDLGATAKAWAADRIADHAAARLGCGVLVSLGGDVALAGPPPFGGWRVGIADHCESPGEAASAVVCLRDGGLATSGIAGRSWRRDGEAVHHLIDPATSRSAKSAWRTVSVAAASCVEANTASTAALILSDAAPAWLDGLGLPARLVATSGQVVLVGDWPPANGS